MLPALVAPEEVPMWNQVYNPFSNEALSTLVAAIPVVTLLALIASGKVKAHFAAVIALVAALVVAVYAFTMPGGMAKAVVHACSVLEFQCTITLLAICDGGLGGASRTGRPLSKWRRMPRR